MSISVQAAPRNLASAAQQTLLRLDGAFLILVGGAQMSFELLSYYWGIGPWGGIFAGSPYTIGFLEAHGLALLIGLLLVRAAASESRRFWHGVALGVHVFLGGANLLFWHSFVGWGLVPAGAIATAFHALFVVAQFICLARPVANVRRR